MQRECLVDEAQDTLTLAFLSQAGWRTLVYDIQL